MHTEVLLTHSQVCVKEVQRILSISTYVHTEVLTHSQDCVKEVQRILSIWYLHNYLSANFPILKLFLQTTNFYSVFNH